MTLEEMRIVAEAACDKVLDKMETAVKDKFGNVPIIGGIIDALFLEAKTLEHDAIDAAVKELLGNPPVPVG